MKRRKRLLLIIIIAFVFVLAALVTTFLFTDFLSIYIKSTPEITILDPQSPAQIKVGKYLYLKSSAWSNRGLDRIEMYVNGTLFRHQIAPAQAPLEMLANFSWVPEETGTYELSVTAFDIDNNPSKPASIQVIADASDIAEGSSGGVEAQPSEGGDQIGSGGILGGHADDESLIQDGRPTLKMLDSSIRRFGGWDIQVEILADDDIALDHINITTISDGAEPEVQDILCGGTEHCEHALIDQLDAGERTILAAAVDSSGQTSEVSMLDFQVMAGDIDLQSALVLFENTVFTSALERFEDTIRNWEALNTLDAFGVPRFVGRECDGNIIKIGIPYRYYSDHGEQVFVTAWVTRGDELIASGVETVRNHTGQANLTMELQEGIEEGLTTDQITLKFMTDPTSGVSFYSETAEFTVNWPSPKPDLSIYDVQRSVSGKLIYVDVQNTGCENVNGFELITHTGSGEENTDAVFTISLPPGSTERVKIENVDPNLYSRAFDVEVDPNNIIEEIDENNNIFLKPQIRLKHIHFTKLEILDTCDQEWHQDSDKGEFILHAEACAIEEKRPHGGKWKLPKGIYEIDIAFDPMVISPDLDWNHDLNVIFTLEEYDEIGSNDWHSVSFTHSADMNDPNSWKRGAGRDLTQQDDRNKFIIHYKIVLEE